MTIPANKRVLLLVDDDSENIQVVHSILKDNYKIRVAKTGAKALELAKIEPSPDLILLDVIMPEMDGYEACRWLKSDQRTRDIPVIFLTGKTEVADEARGFEVGAVDYIHKPFSPPIVTARVRTHLMLRDAHETLNRQLVAINGELEMARQIQLSILPRNTPTLQGLEIEARYVPMSSVAGDFYNFLVIDEKHVGILIADVSGHGLPSALIASMLQTALAAQAPNAPDPAQVLSGLNRALHGKFMNNYYVTAAYLFVDLENSMVNYAGAAHPPLLQWRSKTGRTAAHVENGLMLGPFSDATYSSVSFPLEKGDRLVLITDGVIEAKDSADREFGIDRLRDVMQSHHASPVYGFADALMRELSCWSEHIPGPGQSDDITLLAIDFQGHSSRHARRNTPVNTSLLP
jgi:phosphoserine phosphatase RsbU/P